MVSELYISATCGTTAQMLANCHLLIYFNCLCSARGTLMERFNWLHCDQQYPLMSEKLLKIQLIYKLFKCAQRVLKT